METVMIFTTEIFKIRENEGIEFEETVSQSLETMSFANKKSYLSSILSLPPLIEEIKFSNDTRFAFICKNEIDCKSNSGNFYTDSKIYPGI